MARARQALRQVTFESDANAQARRALAARYLLQTLGNAPRIAREGNAAALAGLLPGMPAAVPIRTAERTALSSLQNPLKAHFARAFKEQ